MFEMIGAETTVEAVRHRPAGEITTTAVQVAAAGETTTIGGQQGMFSHPEAAIGIMTETEGAAEVGVQLGKIQGTVIETAIVQGR